MYGMSVTPDQLSSLGSYIAREWGDYGYRIEGIESPTAAVSVAHVCASDGSRFDVMGDRWGNCRAVPEGLGAAQLTALVLEMHRAAVAN